MTAVMLKCFSPTSCLFPLKEKCFRFCLASLIFSTCGLFKCGFISVDSSVVSVTLIDLNFNLNIGGSRYPLRILIIDNTSLPSNDLLQPFSLVSVAHKFVAVMNRSFFHTFSRFLNTNIGLQLPVFSC